MRISICLPLKDENAGEVFLRSLYKQSHWDIDMITSYKPGIFKALNDCLSRAKGDILYFACGDDSFADQKALENVSNAFVGHTETPFWLYGKTNVVDEAGKLIGCDGRLTTYEELCIKNRIGQPSTFWNHAMYQAAGGFNEEYLHAADYEMWIRFWQMTPPLFLDVPLGVHTRHPGQHSQMNAPALEIEANLISDTYRNNQCQA